MEYEINSCGYDIVFDSANIDAVIGSETIIEVEQAINYIKSGEKEIENYVENVSKPELDNHVETVNKAEISRYITEEKQPEIDGYIDNYINTESKPELNNYLQNDIKTELQVFANEKTLEFDNNAQAKQALVDASAQAAANSEAIAIEKANSAQQSASKAKTSEDNAKISETNAKSSENSCKDILERLGTVIKIKGRVNSESELPTSGNLNGDVYLVGAEGLDAYPEYYWFDDHWDFIGTSSNKLEWGTLQGTLSNQTDLQQALDGKVAITGDQTINHTKTFTSAITRRHEFTGGSAKTLTDVDTNGKGSIAIIPYYTGNKIYHRTYTENTTSGKHAYLDVTVDDSGVAGLHFGGSSSTFNVSFANATQVNVPTPATDDSSTKAATTANVDAKITAQAVKLSGDQTVAGFKTFTSSLTLKDTKNALSTNASTNTYSNIAINDKNNVTLGIFEYRHLTGNGSGISMVLRKRGSESSAVWARIGVFQDTSGNFYTEAPTPVTTDNSTKIATTSWVNTRLGGTGITSTEIAYLDGVSSNIQTQLNGKANTSASNFDATGKSTILGWCIPNYSAGISISNTTTYTAPKRGIFCDCNNNSTTDMNIYVNGTQVCYESKKYVDVQILVDAGDRITANSNFKAKFFPLKGA